MKNVKASGFLLMIIVSLFVVTNVYAQAPRQINYQGFLTDSSGAPIDTTVSMRFSLYDAATGGALLWRETQTVTVGNGIYSVNLGADDPVFNPIDLPFDEQYYLGVAVGGDAEMTPRQPLTSVAYAFRSINDDDTLGGLSCGDGQMARYSGTTSQWECADETGTTLSEPEVETYITNGPLDFAAGSTMGGENISTGSHTHGGRNIAYVTGHVPNAVGGCLGPVPGRSLTFTKLSSTSTLRITYSENIAIAGSGFGSWEIYLDGGPISSPTPLKMALYSDPFHRQSTLVGYAEGVISGEHTFTVNLSVLSGSITCYHGNNSTFLLEVEEI